MYFYVAGFMEEENIIDLLGRWVDDSRVADRNRRFLANER